MTGLRAAFAAIAADPVVTTLADGRPNWVREVTPDGVWVETERSRQLGRPPQLVPAGMIQNAWEYLAAHGTLTNRRLLSADGLTVKRSSFVCALLATLPGVELVNRAFWAIGINLIAISLYVAYAFRKVSYPVSSWKYSFITLLTLFHDALIPLGMMAFLGRFWGVEIDTNFIVAVLVVIGFSVHDTIVVFDRIRENLKKARREPLPQLVNASINEVLSRTIITSLTVVLVLAWLGLEQLSAQLWFLPAGLRLASLWVVPTRRWGWLGLAEVTAQAIKSVVLGYAIFTDTFVAVCIAPRALPAGSAYGGTLVPW